jgi:hypothetical protein
MGILWGGVNYNHGNIVVIVKLVYEVFQSVAGGFWGQ